MYREQNPAVRQAVAKGLSYCLASEAQLSELQAFTNDLAERGWSPPLVAQVERGILVALFGCHTADRLTEHRDNVMA